MLECFRCYESWIVGSDRRDEVDDANRGLANGMRTGCDFRLAAATRADCGRNLAREGARWYGSAR